MQFHFARGETMGIDVPDRHQPNDTAIFVHDRQMADSAGPHQLGDFVDRHAGATAEHVRRHHLADACRLGRPRLGHDPTEHVPLREDADETPSVEHED
jgi:hypothetical protein